MAKTFNAPPVVPRVQQLGPLRRGDWVMHGERIGILNDQGSGVGEVHYTDADGQTMLVAHVVLGELRRAFCDEVPHKRREHLSDDEVHALGFLRRD